MKCPYGDTRDSWINRKYADHKQHVMLLRQTQVNTKSVGLDELRFYGINKTITHWVNKIKNGSKPKYISSKEPLPILFPSLYFLFTCDSVSRDVTILDPMCTHSRSICTFQYLQSCPNTPTHTSTSTHVLTLWIHFVIARFVEMTIFWWRSLC